MSHGRGPATTETGQAKAKMTVRNVASIADRPTVELIRWRIMQTSAGDMHFVGCETLGHKGRVSSAIADFDAAARRGVTRSGRIYLLSRPSGFHPAATYVWTRSCECNKVTAYRDVSSDVMPDATNTSSRRARVANLPKSRP